jgi:hypothetical protein
MSVWYTDRMKRWIKPTDFFAVAFFVAVLVVVAMNKDGIASWLQSLGA